MPAAKPSSAPTRGPPTMPATTARSNMTSGPAPNTRSRSRTVSSTIRNSSKTKGTLARALFISLCLSSRQRALRFPDEHLHEIEAGEIDERVDRHVVLQRSPRHRCRAHPAHRDVAREHAALEPARDDDLAAHHLGADVDEVDWQRLASSVPARHADVARR